MPELEEVENETLPPDLITRFGSYAIYEGGDYNRFSYFHVVDARTGKKRWTIAKSDNMGAGTFSPDETVVALPNDSQDHWEIRALASGQLLRSLPMIPDASENESAFSPDGATLYSVADGKLYRQRAR